MKVRKRTEFGRHIIADPEICHGQLTFHPSLRLLQVVLSSRRQIFMSFTLDHPLPRLDRLPTSLPVEGAVRIELEEGTPVFRASSAVQTRIEALLSKQHASGLSQEEEQELDGYEEVDDYLSFLNRVVRNLVQAQVVQGG